MAFYHNNYAQFPSTDSKIQTGNSSHNYQYLKNKTSDIQLLNSKVDELEKMFIEFQEQNKLNLLTLNNRISSQKKKIRYLLKKINYDTPSRSHFLNSTVQDPLTIIVLCLSIIAILLCLTRK